MDLKKSNLYGYLANQCVMSQDYDCAIAFYKDAIELFQLDYRYFVNRSFCYDRLNQFTEALEDADRAIKLHPIGPNCHFRKGRALKGLKHFERAQESFEKVIELVGQNCPEANYELIQIRKVMNNEKGETDDDDNKEYQQIVTLNETQETLNDQIWLEESHPLATEQNDLPKMVQTQTKAVATGQPLGLICDILTRFSLNDPHSENGYIQQPQNQSVFSDQHQIGDKEFQLIAKSMTVRPQNNKHYHHHHHHHHHRQRFNGDECYYWRTTGCIFPENCKKLHIPANKGIEYQPWMNQRRRKISSSSNRSSNNRDGNNLNHNNGNHNYTNNNTNSNANNINGSNSTDSNSNGNNNNQGNTSRRNNNKTNHHNNNENRFHRNTFHRKPKSKNNLRNNHNSNNSNNHNPSSNFNSNNHNPSSNFNSNNLFCNYNSSNSNNYSPVNNFNSNNYNSNSNSNSNYDSNSSISNNTNNSK